MRRGTSKREGKKKKSPRSSLERILMPDESIDGGDLEHQIVWQAKSVSQPTNQSANSVCGCGGVLHWPAGVKSFLSSFVPLRS